MSETIAALISASRGHVIAPAGYGKTEAIARAVLADLGRRHLILTHMHAGVHALRARLRALGVRGKHAEVHTIAGFALRFASRYPATSALSVAEPTSTNDWFNVYEAAHRLFDRAFAVRVLQASYGSVFVDEYQDCTLKHHAIVTTLARILPVRILGDPLQGIFHFGSKYGDPIVDWDRHVSPVFPALPPLNVPYRWRSKNPALGEWLADARARLTNGKELNLDSPIISHLDGDHERRIAACRRAATSSETVAALIDLPNRAHGIAKQLQGQYNCMEPMGAPDLHAAAARFDATEGTSRALQLVKFAETCMSNTGKHLKAVKSRLSKGGVPRVRAGATNADAVTALCRVAEESHPKSTLHALDTIAELPGVHKYRRELLAELRRALHRQQENPDRLLTTCAWEVRELTRQQGRAPSRLSVTRPVLAKGLEFDSVIVLDATTYTDARDLYVAMTRASRKLTIIGSPPTLAFRDGLHDARDLLAQSAD